MSSVSMPFGAGVVAERRVASAMECAPPQGGQQTAEAASIASNRCSRSNSPGQALAGRPQPRYLAAPRAAAAQSGLTGPAARLGGHRCTRLEIFTVPGEQISRPAAQRPGHPAPSRSVPSRIRSKQE